MPLEWSNSRITKIEPINQNVRRFWFEMDGLQRFDFKPGQFVTLDLPIGVKPIDRWRSYSIASHPDGSNLIELVIVLLDGGKGTTFLFDQAGVGTEIPFRGPLGKFTLSEDPGGETCMICTGTGIAPFRSMLNDLLEHPRNHAPIHLIFGSRLMEDILYYDEMRELARKLPDFKYYVTLSREKSETWDGYKGYVHDIYEKLFEDKRPAHFYLCGWKVMIDEARERLLKMGYDRKQVHMEIYG